MNLESQVPQLKYCQRIAELGVKIDSLFWWTQDKTPGNPNMHLYGLSQNEMPWHILYTQQSRLSGSCVYEEVAAPTVAELGKMLLQEQDMPYYSCGEWTSLGYYDLSSGRARITADTEADARAAMLVYLLEHDILKPNGGMEK